MSVIRWEDPPPIDTRANHTRRRFDAAATAAALRARPGRWAVVAENGSGSLTTRIMRGLGAAFWPAGSFEAAHRTINGVRTVYARYIGAPSTEDGHG